MFDCINTKELWTVIKEEKLLRVNFILIFHSMFKWQVFHTDTRDELLASVFGAAARVRELKISSDEKHAILAHES